MGSDLKNGLLFWSIPNAGLVVSLPIIQVELFREPDAGFNRNDMLQGSVLFSVPVPALALPISGIDILFDPLDESDWGW